ncbi:fibronectin type III domain-containing protein 9 [Colossoma macropomum]|uniref:fibronectin type III domain-containing protein 9 n=1 Tax=Colossoma macropomum TaxID=42526 RepID=UPI0018651814|nr:fibronectin type III domain-containing protein 9 [Colossoma macropomum]
MMINVQNVSATSAIVSWPSMPGCVDTFYSVMYHPNWNSLMMGYTRKSFMREERIPVSQTTTHLGNLSPQTTYILCVTCQSANPTRDQCQLFSTLDEGADRGGSRRELAMGVWLASSILLFIIAVVLLWACLHSICPAKRHSEGGSRPGSTPPSQALTPRNDYGTREGRESLYTPSYSEEDSQQATVIENPFHTEHGGVPVNGQSHELKTLGNKQNGGPELA